METGDGLLARVRAPRGRLSLDQAVALADASTSCGNGAIGLSSRANLHLRGLNERTLAGLHARLDDAGLIDRDPEVERLRNIVASPLDDLDPEAFFDLGASLDALEIRLREDERLRALPSKFSFVLDAEGRLALGVVDADIRFEAAPGARFWVFLAGEDALCAECAPFETGDVGARLGRAFVALAGDGEGEPRRMRALVERGGARVVFRKAALEARRSDGCRCATSLARTSSAQRPSSAPRRPSGKSTPASSGRSSNGRARLAQMASGSPPGVRS
jgi:precorrin-3B synthase